MAVFISALTFGQEITGKWNGLLKVQGMQVRIVFNIFKTENRFSATMDSPDQKVNGIPVTTTAFENSVLKLEIKDAGITYEGTLNKDQIITGNFKQGGQNIALDLSREVVKKDIIVRAQEPQKPYPYYTEDVAFENKIDNVVLAGTLSLPQKEGNFPVVILISGSGKQNRDEEILGHKPFLVLADYLTRKGIGVLRFDDRGAGKSTGDFSKATTADFSKDVEAAVVYLKTRKEINKNKIGLVGHSEGGVINAIVAGNSKDINYIVSLAGPGLRGDKLLLLQRELIERQMGISETEILKSKDVYSGVYKIILNSTSNDEKLKTEVSNYFKSKLGVTTTDDQLTIMSESVLNPWMYYFLRFDPTTAFKKVKCPVLALNGSKDLQVPAEVNLQAVKTAVLSGGNKKVTTKNLPDLNHFFQECKTGSPAEYGAIEQTFSPIALEEISGWILSQVK
ncbi:alpha/beta hydrolase family protein [Flavobacterium hungaricum]|nr:alpha/beta fold hydrolase [Flavobacterium hungaricum]